MLKLDGKNLFNKLK